MKAPKKKGPEFEDEEDKAFKEKQKADAQAKKELAQKAKGGGPLTGGGIKKYVVVFVTVFTNCVGLKSKLDYLCNFIIYSFLFTLNFGVVYIFYYYGVREPHQMRLT